MYTPGLSKAAQFSGSLQIEGRRACINRSTFWSLSVPCSPVATESKYRGKTFVTQICFVPENTACQRSSHLPITRSLRLPSILISMMGRSACSVPFACPPSSVDKAIVDSSLLLDSSQLSSSCQVGLRRDSATKNSHKVRVLASRIWMKSQKNRQGQ